MVLSSSSSCNQSTVLSGSTMSTSRSRSQPVEEMKTSCSSLTLGSAIEELAFLFKKQDDGTTTAFCSESDEEESYDDEDAFNDANDYHIQSTMKELEVTRSRLDSVRHKILRDKMRQFQEMLTSFNQDDDSSDDEDDYDEEDAEMFCVP